MSTLYLPDTNILVHLVRRDAEPRPIMSVVTAGELRSLAYQLKWGKEKSEKAFFLLNYFVKTSIDDTDIIEAYALIDAYSESVGRSMGKNDLWIAATAKITSATLLTTDKDFDHLHPHFINRIWISPDVERKAKGA